jgi:hypothetical protein
MARHIAINKTAVVTSGARTADPFGAHEFTPDS